MKTAVTRLFGKKALKPESPILTEQPKSAGTREAREHNKEKAKNRRKKRREKTVEKRSEYKPAQLLPMEGWTPPAISEDELADNAESVFFRNLNIHDRILRAVLDDLGFKSCTPVQAKALPPSLDGKDVAGMAQTGTGKTAAFLIAVLQRFLSEGSGDRKPNQPFALVLAPTRELAIQIDSDAEKLAKYCGMNHLAVFGGMNFDKQANAIKTNVDLVTATPGRLIDYARRKIIDLSKVRILVLDEADRMLDMGFIPDVRRILAMLPAASQRQTLLFSATLPPPIVQLANKWMVEPVHIEVTPENVIADGIEEVVYAVSEKDKLALLNWLLEHETTDRVLIFCNRRSEVDALQRHLYRYEIEGEVLTGDVPQKKRMNVLDRFKNGEIRLIVATDVAGRGIHVDGISHVINFDLPYDADDYVHRVGRTGRAGESGRAISFACESGSFTLPDIEEYIQRKLPITHPEPEMLKISAPRRPGPPMKKRNNNNRPRRNNNRNNRSHSSGRRPPRRR